MDLRDEQRMMQLLEDNNKILHRLQRAARWGRFIHFLYWVLIIGSTLGTLYYLQPYLSGLTNLLNKLQSGIQSIEGASSQLKLPEGLDINSLLKKF